MTQEERTGEEPERREIKYTSFEQALADMERLVQDGYRTVGNWSFGQILDHLARSVDRMIDGSDWKMGKFGQFMMRLLMKKTFLNGPLRPGFRIPAQGADYLPDDVSAEEGLNRLQTAVRRLNETSQRAENGALGRLTREEWDQFQLRHFELHMSFVVPAA